MFVINKKGSVSIEALMIIPVFFILIILLIGYLRVYLLYNCVSEALYNTSDFAINYGPLYKDMGVDSIKEIVGNKIGDKININNILNYSDDILYLKTFELYFTNEIEKNKIYCLMFKDNVKWDFTGSDFFNNNDEFYMSGVFYYKLNVPLTEKIFNGFSFRKNILVRVFSNGIVSYSTNTDDSNIWGLTNFQRGKLLEKQFGGNLPENFPVIDVYEKGIAKMIVSLNHTLPTYTNNKNFEMKLNEYLEKMVNFKGAKYGNSSVENIIGRAIILILPENQLNNSQKIVLNNFEKKCGYNNVKLKVERYQYSD
ncbi:MAG: hypothetical protein E7388_01215 [Ruminococcaceae bacterium]|nr:hypothetical protein [Oscillospiraceae bacterium]